MRLKAGEITPEKTWPIIAAVMCTALFTGIALADTRTLKALAAEEGSIEMSGAIFLLAGGILVLLRRRWWAWVHVSMAFLLLVERELEPVVLAGAPVLHDALSYLDTVILDDPAVRVVLLVCLLAGCAFFTMPWLRRVWPSHGRAIKRAVLLAALAVVCAQLLEGLASAPAGVQNAAAVRFQFVEELLESVFAAIMLWLACHTRRV